MSRCLATDRPRAARAMVACGTFCLVTSVAGLACEVSASIRASIAAAGMFLSHSSSAVASRRLAESQRWFAPPRWSSPHDNARRRLFSGTTQQRIEASAAGCGLILPHQPQPTIPLQARIGIRRVDYFGGPHDLHFSADQ